MDFYHPAVCVQLEWEKRQCGKFDLDAHTCWQMFNETKEPEAHIEGNTP